ncbi:hypothetical protein M4578_04445 [Salipiger sp. P9]|uniref:calcium-binding protein n=1 Tax=Salipiger pentaromativorans TaxID=2943193 RepID=UPI002157AFE5|nr:calcium-binding protein [Salipiger pentaromativorans]MCR8547066.1 hypothetical protein [Salipiger pentaromativorans]
MEWMILLMASLLGATVFSAGDSSSDDDDEIPDGEESPDELEGAPEEPEGTPEEPEETPEEPGGSPEEPEEPREEGGTPATYGDSFQPAQIDGESVLLGTDGDDTLVEYSDLAHEELRGSASSLLGGDGDDWINIHDNGSFLASSSDGFTADGEGGDDTLRAVSYESRVSLRGGDGDDQLIGEGVALYGDDGNDYLESTPFSGEEFGIQTVEGGAGNDTINALEGLADIDGGTGDDYVAAGHFSTVSGGEGDDYLRVLDKDTTIDGGEGNDTIWATLELGPSETLNANIYATETDYAVELTGGEGEDEFDMWLTLDHVDSQNEDPMVVARITDFDPAEDVLMLNLQVNSVTAGDFAQDYDRLLSSGELGDIGAPTLNESLEVSALEIGPDDAYTDIVLSGTGSTLEGTFTREFIVRVEGVALQEGDFVVQLH